MLTSQSFVQGVWLKESSLKRLQMGGATDSGEGVLEMESDYYMLSQKRKL